MPSHLDTYGNHHVEDVYDEAPVDGETMIIE